MIKNAFIEVFKNKSYLLLSGVVAFLTFAFAVWLPNIRLLSSLVTDPTVPTSVKILFPIRLFESITTNFTTLSALYTIIIALLTGINVALFVYYAKRQRQLAQGGLAVSSVGIISGILGMGCAACGSLILTSLLGTAGGIGVIALLPLRGGEFGILGVVLLGLATYLLAKQISKTIVCKVSIIKKLKT